MRKPAALASSARAAAICSSDIGPVVKRSIRIFVFGNVAGGERRFDCVHHRPRPTDEEGIDAVGVNEGSQKRVAFGAIETAIEKFDFVGFVFEEMKTWRRST